MILSRRAVFAAAAFALLASAAPAMADLKFGVAAEPYPPFTSKDASGTWVGWEIDLMNAVCAQMNEKCELVEVAWDGIIPALTSQADRRHLVVHVDHRRAQEDHRLHRHVLQPADRHHRRQERRHGHHARASQGQDHRRAGFDHPRRLRRRNISAPGSTIKTYQTQDEANNDLAAGRLDYVQADGIGARCLP